MKGVKKLLKEQSKHILPDKSVKENIRRELGYSDAEQSAAYAHGGTSGDNRKKWIALVAAGLAIVLCLCIVLPVALHRTPAGPGIIDSGKLDSIDTADEFYAYSAASVGSLLAAAQSGALHETAAGVHPESDAAALRAAALKLAAEATARQAVAQRILMALSDEKKAKK